MKPLILGSQSPRRKDVLSMFSLETEIKISDFDEESVPFRGDPFSYAIAIAESKALLLQTKVEPERLILTADTVVHHEGTMFGKPVDREEGKRFLRALAGKWHDVITAVSLCQGNRLFTGTALTRVLFHPISEQEIETYYSSLSCFDKAGGYMIQGAGSIIVSQIQGCYYNVLGLPLTPLKDGLSYFGIDLWHYLKNP